MKRIPRSHPLHNFCVIVALTIVVAAQTCLAFDPNEWRNTQAVEVPAKGLVRVNIPAATLDGAQTGLKTCALSILQKARSLISSSDCCRSPNQRYGQANFAASSRTARCI